MAIKAADRGQVPVNVCGQMSGSSVYTMLLLGMGLRRFSVPPSAIPEIKKVCRTVTLAAMRSGSPPSDDHGKCTKHQELLA